MEVAPSQCMLSMNCSYWVCITFVFLLGSRSTPLVLAIEAHPDVTSHVLDERSSAFFALGLAKALQKPVAIVTTSGTAMANAYPALIEASLSRSIDLHKCR